MKNWKLVLKMGLVALVMVSWKNAWGQLSLTNGGNSATIDFSSSMPTTVGTNPSTAYAAAGFSPNPTSAGRLNSNAWSVTGWSDGDLTFGGTRVSPPTTDYARGTTAIAISTGGFYAYIGGSSAPTFMIQPGGTDFAPGTLTLRMKNDGTTNITQIAISYNIFIRNDQGRSNSFNFEYSTDDVSYVNGGIDYTSPMAADGNGWVQVGSSPSRATTISGLLIPPGNLFYIRWSSADVAGSGSRDEFGLDDISISATFETSCTPPTTQATNFSATNIQSNQMQANWMRGNGDNVLVVARAGGAVNADPTNGTTYTANPAFGSGSQIGTGNYVVYNGTGSFETVTGLTAFTAYHYAIYEYNTTGTCYNLIELTGNATTLCSPPTTQATSFSATNIQGNQMQANWVRGNGNNVLVVARQGSPVDADPTIGTTYTANATFGSGTQIGTGNYVVYNGTGTNVTVTGLTGSTEYYYAIYEYTTAGTCYNLTELTGSGTTLCSPPTTQASSFSATNIQNDQMQANWVRGNGTSGVLVVARQGSAVNADPSSGTSYVANATFGSGDQIGTGNFVVYNGSGTNVNVTALTVNTTYHYAIYEYNSAGVCYNLTKLTGNATTTCTQPSTQAISFSASNIQTNQMQVDWVRGNGDNIIVVARQGSAVNTDPSNGTGYTANAAFGSGSQIGTGNYVVYNGTGTSVTVTALLSFTVYHFAIYEYNSVDNCYNAIELTGNATTICSPPATQATNFSATNIQPTQMQANWARGNGTAGVLVVARQGSPVDTDPTSGTTYTANAAFGSGTQIGTGNYVVYKGTGTNVTITALTSFTTYHYAIYEYNTSGICFNLTELTGNATTLCSPPISQATTFSATNIQANQMQANWVRGNGTAGVLVVARQGGVVTTDPSSGTSYTANAAFGNGSQIGTGNYVVYSGTSTNVTITALTANTTYHFAIYEYNSLGVCYNTTELTGNAKTLLANDNCSGAIALTAFSTPTCGGATSGTTVGATDSGIGSFTCNGFTGNPDDDVWYSFVATSANHTITVVGASPLDAVVDLRSGTCNGSNIACADATTSGGTEVINATGLTIGATYLIRIYGYGTVSSGAGTFTICVTTTPPPSYFRSKQTGNWTGTTTWQYSTDNSNWNDAVAAPTSIDLSIIIRNNHTVTVSSDITADEIAIESGGIISHTGGIFTINNGTGNDLTIQNGGKLSLPSNSIYPNTSTGAVISVQNGGIITASGSSNINNIQTTNFDYQNGSILEYTSNNAPATSGVTFFPNANSTTIPIFRITGTPGSVGGGSPTIINGTLEVSSGASIGWTGSGTKTFRNGITGAGTVTQGTAGQFLITGTASSIAGGTLTLSTSGMSITGTSVVTLESNETVNGGTVSVESGGILNTASSSIGGTTNFTLSSGGNFITANTNGISGSLINSGTKSLSTGANYEFNGSDQTFGTSLPATVNNLTLSGSGTKTISGNRTINGNLTISGATLSLAAGLTYNLRGNLTNNGVTTLWTGTTFIFDGTNLQSIGGATVTNFGDLTISNTNAGGVASNNTFAVLGNLRINQGSKMNLVAGNDSPIDGSLFLNNVEQYAGTWGSSSSSPPAMYQSNLYFAGTKRLTVAMGAPLPIELISFTAKKEQQTTALEWETASELNNEKFLVERSANGADFTPIGEVLGNGTTTIAQSYYFTDRLPISGTNYYRLKQIDFDGNFEFSKVVSVSFGDSKNRVQLYPTITNDAITLSFSSPTDEPGSIQIFDYNGKFVSLLRLEPDIEQLTIAVNALQSGPYLLKIFDGKTVETLRFSKL